MVSNQSIRSDTRPVKLSELARKEKIAITFVAMAILSLIAMIMLFVVFDVIKDIAVFFYTALLAGVSIMLVFFGFSTWFYMSNEKIARKHARIFIVIILILYSSGILIVSLLVDIKYSYNTVASYFKTEDIFYKSDRFMVIIAVNIGRIVAIVLICICAWIIKKKIKRKN